MATLMRSVLFVLAVLALFAVASMASAVEDRPFIWADDEDYWPAIYRGSNGGPAGIFNDILTEVFARLDIPLEKSVYPWSRAQMMVKNGDADGMVTVYTKERAKFTVATDPIWEIGETLFFLRTNPRACDILKVDSLEDMRDFTLVDIQGSGWTEEQYKIHGIKNVIWVPDTDSALNSIAAGRADIFIMFDLNAYKLLTKKRVEEGPLAEGFQNIITIMPNFARLPFRLLIRKDSPFAERVDDINKVLEEMKKDGTMQRIRLKYAGIVPLQ